MDAGHCTGDVAAGISSRPSSSIAHTGYMLMGLATNWLAASVLAASILFYVLVYTVWLKRRTAQNIVIGGAAGARAFLRWYRARRTPEFPVVA